MSEPFVGEIRIFGGNFAPAGWAFCDGQLLPIRQNTALFSLLGTTYGGNGINTFALPDLTGRAPMHPGQGTGLTMRYLGEETGSSDVTLLNAEMPVHGHQAMSLPASTQESPSEAYWSNTYGRQGTPAYAAGNPNTNMGPLAIAAAGGNLPHNNRQPYLGLNFIIALQGIFPSRP